MQPSSMAQWCALVNEAELAVGYQLKEALESYLIFLLMRFSNKPEMATKIIALEYLHGLVSCGHIRQEKLRAVGDQCLLYSGLFPKRAERLQLRISYFVDIGRSAYYALSATKNEIDDVYADLSNEFITLMGVLQAMRLVAGKTSLRGC